MEVLVLIHSEFGKGGTGFLVCIVGTLKLSTVPSPHFTLEVLSLHRDSSSYDKAKHTSVCHTRVYEEARALFTHSSNTH